MGETKFVPSVYSESISTETCYLNNAGEFVTGSREECVPGL